MTISFAKVQACRPSLARDSRDGTLPTQLYLPKHFAGGSDLAAHIFPPLSWYHYQPQLTRALNACSPARAEPARSLGSTENHSSQQILLLSLFNLLFPDAPQNNPALTDRVRELAQLQTNNILTPEKGAGNVTGLRYQVAAPTLLEAAQYWRGS